jgi:hypothetical protein
MRAKHAFGKGAVLLVGLALVALVAVTTGSTNTPTAAPVHLYWANFERGGCALGWDDDRSGAARWDGR